MHALTTHCCGWLPKGSAGFAWERSGHGRTWGGKLKLSSRRSYCASSFHTPSRTSSISPMTSFPRLLPCMMHGRRSAPSLTWRHPQLSNSEVEYTLSTMAQYPCFGDHVLGTRRKRLPFITHYSCYLLPPFFVSTAKVMYWALWLDHHVDVLWMKNNSGKVPETMDQGLPADRYARFGAGNLCQQPACTPLRDESNSWAVSTALESTTASQVHGCTGIADSPGRGHLLDQSDMTCPRPATSRPYYHVQGPSLHAKSFLPSIIWNLQPPKPPHSSFASRVQPHYLNTDNGFSSTLEFNPKL